MIGDMVWWPADSEWAWRVDSVIGTQDGDRYLAISRGETAADCVTRVVPEAAVSSNAFQAPESVVEPQNERATHPERGRDMSWNVALRDHTAPLWCDYGTPLDQWTPKYDFETEPCPSPCYPAVEVGRHQEGGTYALDGVSEAEVSITYNYGRHYREASDDPTPDAPNILGRMLDGQRAADVIPVLEKAIAKLGTMRDQDYWKATPGNAGAMLAVLLGWARLHPDAVFHVS